MSLDLTRRYVWAEPNFAIPLDIEANRALAIDRGITVKGMFVSPLLEELPWEARAGRRFLAFLDYPAVEMIDLMVDIVEMKRGVLQPREVLRQIGQSAYPIFAKSMVGRALMGIFGSDLSSVLERAPRAYDLSIQGGKVTSLRLDERHYRLGYENVPFFLDCYQVGVVEGAARFVQVSAEVRCALLAEGTGVLDVRW